MKIAIVILLIGIYAIYLKNSKDDYEYFEDD